MKEGENMSKADEIIINCFGKLEVTTAGIYYEQLKKLIKKIEYLSNPKQYMIFCNPITAEYIKPIARYYKMEYKISLYLPEDTLFVLTDKKIFKPNYERMIKEIRLGINNK
jgi:hypothetical protein